MQTLNSLMLRFSQSWPLFLLAAVITFGSIYLFTGVIEPRFTALTGGAPPFDLQNSLTVDQVCEQLAAYTAEARRLVVSRETVSPSSLASRPCSTGIEKR